VDTLLVVPAELLPAWAGKGPVYEQLCEVSPGPIDYLPIGTGFGVLVAGPEGDIVHEAWFVRESPEQPMILAAWNEWGTVDRDAWLIAQAGRADLAWTRHEQALVVESGMLVLVHAEDPGPRARLAPPNRSAVCGECVQVGIAAGTYAVETTEIEERPDGAHCIELVRFVWLAVT
jgi:hypothetical protein